MVLTILTLQNVWRKKKQKQKIIRLGNRRHINKTFLPSYHKPISDIRVMFSAGTISQIGLL